MQRDFAALKRKYDQNGFVVVHSLFSPDQIQDLRSLCVSTFEAYSQTLKENSYQAVIWQLHRLYDHVPAFKNFVLSPEVGAIGRAVLQADVRLFLDQLICKRPGSRPTVAHQDAPFMPFDKAKSVNCWVAMSDTTPFNGAIGYYRGSHRLGQLSLTHLDNGKGLESVHPEVADYAFETQIMRAGDCVFHDSLTIHAATANETAEPRWSLSFQLMADGLMCAGPPHPFMQKYGITQGSRLNQGCFPILP